MSTYQIIVVSRGMEVQNFSLFAEVPDTSGGSTPNYLLSNVYATSRPIYGTPLLLDSPKQPRPNFQQFAVTTDAYAVCGYDVINEQAVLSGTDNVAVNPNDDCSDAANCIVAQGGPGFTATTGGAAGSGGSFDIRVSPYNKNLFPNVWVGYGKQGPIGSLYPEEGNNGINRTLSAIRSIRPCATWPASPNQSYNINPRNAFYIATGSYPLGQAIDLSRIRDNDKVKIDFTDQPDKLYAYVECVGGIYTEPKYTVDPPEVLTTPILDTSDPSVPPESKLQNLTLSFKVKGRDLIGIEDPVVITAEPHTVIAN